MRTGVLVCILLLAASAAPAQTPTAVVVGTVTDPSGAVVPGVSVKITNLDTNIAQQGLSNEIGDFKIPFLHPGR